MTEVKLFVARFLDVNEERRRRIEQVFEEFFAELFDVESEESLEEGFFDSEEAVRARYPRLVQAAEAMQRPIVEETFRDLEYVDFDASEPPKFREVRVGTSSGYLRFVPAPAVGYWNVRYDAEVGSSADWGLLEGVAKYAGAYATAVFDDTDSLPFQIPMPSFYVVELDAALHRACREALSSFLKQNAGKQRMIDAGLEVQLRCVLDSLDRAGSS